MAATAVSVAVNAGIGFATGGPAGAAIAGGLALTSSILNRWAEEDSDDAGRALRIKENAIKGSLVPAE